MNLQEVKNLIIEHYGQFYVYLLKRPNGIPFYVGKGSCDKGFRIENHYNEAFRNKKGNRHKINTIRNIVNNGGQIDYEIVLFTDNEDAAFDLEIELIAYYGRQKDGGVLTNLTDGGEGILGHVHSEQSKIAMSINHKVCNAWNKGIKGIFHMSEESKIKISKAMSGENNPFYGKTHSDKVRKKISKNGKGKLAWNKGIPWNEEVKMKFKESWRRRKELIQ